MHPLRGQQMPAADALDDEFLHEDLVALSGDELESADEGGARSGSGEGADEGADEAPAAAADAAKKRKRREKEKERKAKVGALLLWHARAWC
jgi:protein CMS1